MRISQQPLRGYSLLTRSLNSFGAMGGTWEGVSDFQKKIQKQLDNNPEISKSIQELLVLKDDQLKNVARKATIEMVNILNTIDENCDKNTEVSVNYTIGIASVTLTRKSD